MGTPVELSTNALTSGSDLSYAECKPTDYGQCTPAQGLLESSSRLQNVGWKVPEPTFPSQLWNNYASDY